MSVQCRLCKLWFHYDEDQPVCASCYYMFKKMEIYGKPNNSFYLGEEE